MAKSIAFILVAAGNSTRLGKGEKKQFLTIGKKALFQYPLDVFISFAIDNPALNCKVLLVLPSVMLDDFSGRYDVYKPLIDSGNLILVSGGETRAFSVFNGIQAVAQSEDCLICVHDAARPLLHSNQISQFIEALIKIPKGAVLVSGKWAKDTILQSDLHKDHIEAFLDRDKIFQAETPQGFFLKDYKELIKQLESLPHSIENYTDESTLFLNRNKKVLPFNQEGPNFKVTYSEDLELARLILKKKKVSFKKKSHKSIDGTGNL